MNNYIIVKRYYCTKYPYRLQGGGRLFDMKVTVCFCEPIMSIKKVKEKC